MSDFNHLRLKQLRKDAGISVDDTIYALRRLGCKISGQTLRNWEEGVYIPKADDVAAVCKLYKVKFEFFTKNA